jgi:hypothetical protein
MPQFCVFASACIKPLHPAHPHVLTVLHACGLRLHTLAWELDGCSGSEVAATSTAGRGLPMQGMAAHFGSLLIKHSATVSSLMDVTLLGTQGHTSCVWPWYYHILYVDEPNASLSPVPMENGKSLVGAAVCAIRTGRSQSGQGPLACLPVFILATGQSRVRQARM